jgi:hypothetical protein
MAIPKKSANTAKGGKKLVKAKQAATIFKSKTASSLFQNKVKRANTLLWKASFLKKEDCATG